MARTSRVVYLYVKKKIGLLERVVCLTSAIFAVSKAMAPVATGRKFKNS